MTDDEYFWEPVPNCLSIRRRAHGPGPAATRLVGAGEWGRDSTWPAHPSPPPLSTIGWRLNHISEMLARRADYTIGDHSLTADDYRIPGSAVGGIAAFKSGAAAWRKALVTADDAALDMVGHSDYPDGSDPEQPFLEVVWWVNQEVLHHGAEISLLRTSAGPALILTAADRLLGSVPEPEMLSHSCYKDSCPRISPRPAGRRRLSTLPVRQGSPGPQSRASSTTCATSIRRSPRWSGRRSPRPVTCRIGPRDRWSPAVRGRSRWSSRRPRPGAGDPFLAASSATRSSAGSPAASLGVLSTARHPREPDAAATVRQARAQLLGHLRQGDTRRRARDFAAAAATRSRGGWSRPASRRCSSDAPPSRWRSVTSTSTSDRGESSPPTTRRARLPARRRRSPARSTAGGPPIDSPDSVPRWPAMVRRTCRRSKAASLKRRRTRACSGCSTRSPEVDGVFVANDLMAQGALPGSARKRPASAGRRGRRRLRRQQRGTRVTAGADDRAAARGGHGRRDGPDAAVAHRRPGSACGIGHFRPNPGGTRLCLKLPRGPLLRVTARLWLEAP